MVIVSVGAIAYAVITQEIIIRDRLKKDKPRFVKRCENCNHFERLEQRPHLGRCNYFFKDCFADSLCHRWRKKGVDDED